MKPLFLAMLLTASTVCADETPALKTAFKDHFLIGAALGPGQFNGADTVGAGIVKAQFNSITPENVLKWEKIHPQRGEYDFTLADQFVEFGQTNGMAIIGHTLVWHSQTPDWVFQDDKGTPLTREQLLARMRDHIQTVVGRYKGRVKGWDVVNEALESNGSLRNSPWRKLIGDDFIEKAFRFAHEADPQAELYYNDYSLESEPKRNGAVALVKKLQAAGVPIHGIGTQQHVSLNKPTLEQVDATLAAFGQLGVKVMVTELDVDVLPTRARNQDADISRRLAADPALNPYTNGLPAEVEQALAKRYAGLFEIYLKHSATLDRVTFWGVSDGGSWLNHWPVPGRTAYPLLFDRKGKPKPAFDAVLKTALPERGLKLSRSEPVLPR